ncbi:MAG: hypothetical protein U0Y68_09770 [Blastocatellia bacterium]
MEGRYQDAVNRTYQTVAAPVTTPVKAVAGLTVSANDQTPSGSAPRGEPFVRPLTFCNAGNIPQPLYLSLATITAPAIITALYFDLDKSGTVTPGDVPITVNQTRSPILPVGGCITVLVVIDPREPPPGTILDLTITGQVDITGTINTPVSATGRLLTQIGQGAVMTDPDAPAQPPRKTVDRPRVAGTEPLTYTISFRNRGDLAGQNVLVKDTLPDTLAYVSGSLKLGNRALTDADDTDEGKVEGQTICVKLATVGLEETVTLSFQARLRPAVAPGTGIVNQALLTGTNLPRAGVQTTTAVVLAQPYGQVFQGHSLGSAMIGGARLTLTRDEAGVDVVSLPAGTGTSGRDSLEPNPKNDNPFVTEVRGAFGFQLAPVLSGSAPATYYLHVRADNYRNRVLRLTVTPATNGLFSLMIAALDQQPLCVGASFQLTDNEVTLPNMGLLAFNLPLFNPADLSLTKSTDLQQAEIGDVLSYRIQIANPTAVTLTYVTVEDTPPPSFHYAPGSAQLQGAGSTSGTPVEPVWKDGKLVFSLGQLAPKASVQVIYRLRVGANAQTGEQRNNARAQATFPDGTVAQTGNVFASVLVGQGLFSLRQIVVGRGYVDRNLNGQFDNDDLPVAGARLFLDNGQAVITDARGQYNFPAVESGSVVVALDRESVPKSLQLVDSEVKQEKSWTRLLRTPLGGGGLLQQDFALTGTLPDPVIANARKNLMEVASSNANSSGSSGTNRTRGSTGSTTPPRVPAAVTSVTCAPLTLAQTWSSNNALPTACAQLAAEHVTPVPPGEVRLLSPAANDVAKTPATELTVRVAQDWQARVEVEGQVLPEMSIGKRIVDQKNRVTTITFIAVNLKPGPNRVRLWALAADGKLGPEVEAVIFRRGPAVRLELKAERAEILADGRDQTVLKARLFDQWNHPAEDTEVAFATTAGQLSGTMEAAAGKRDETSTMVKNGSSKPAVPAQHEPQVVMSNEGEAVVTLIAEAAPKRAEVRATAGRNLQAQTEVRLTAALRQPLLTGLAELSFGAAAPLRDAQDTPEPFRSFTRFFFTGSLLRTNNLLTLAYNSRRPLNRLFGRDHVFGPDPLERVYQVFGDASQRYNGAASNTKLFARVDRGRSYAMFGDFTPFSDSTQGLSQGRLVVNSGLSAFDNSHGLQAGPVLAGYTRRLTGIKLHGENRLGDFLTLAGARPDTAFARDVIPGGSLGLLQLSHVRLLPGSEVLTLEVRDRRNPELMLERQPLARAVDYNLDPLNGQVFFLRPISAFDFNLNLVQVVATYEYRAAGLQSGVYTARGAKTFSALGTRAAASFVHQQQAEFGPYYLGGIEVNQPLWQKGWLNIEWAMTHGRPASSLNLAGFNVAGFASGLGGISTTAPLGTGQLGSTPTVAPELAQNADGGQALRVELQQPLPLAEAMLSASYVRSSGGFNNPFGATVVGGSQRANVMLALKPGAATELQLTGSDERNRTNNVDNARQTVATQVVQHLSDKFSLKFGYDFRHFGGTTNAQLVTAPTDPATSPTVAPQQVDSHLVKAGAEWQPHAKLQIAVQREQNLASASDPSYPTQTTIGAKYQVRTQSSLFFTQRLAAAPIVPISDVLATGFGASSARSETAVGIETKLGTATGLTCRYQLENSATSTDNFAVIGLQNRLPLSQQLALELGYERGQYLGGTGHGPLSVSFNSGTFGLQWKPHRDLVTAVRYELRDRSGLGTVFTLGVAGKINESLTALGRWQQAHTKALGSENDVTAGSLAMAWRPWNNDRTALLFSYDQRAFAQHSPTLVTANRNRVDALSSDGLWQVNRRLLLAARVALKYSQNGTPEYPLVSAFTLLSQGRMEYRFNAAWDSALEVRSVWQFASQTRRTSLGAELGYWVSPELRMGLGYNFTAAKEPGAQLYSALPNASRRGLYFLLSAKLANRFNLLTQPTTDTTATTESSVTSPSPKELPPTKQSPPEKR